MSDILFTILHKWTVTNSDRLNRLGFILSLESKIDSRGDAESILELESRKYLGRLTINEFGNATIACGQLSSAEVRRGSCSIFTEEQLEDALDQLLGWMGQANERVTEKHAPFFCPERKMNFRSRKEALSYKKQSKMADYYEAYQCRYCGLWHFKSGKKRRS